LSGTTSDYTLALIDQDNRIVERAVLNKDGSFSYQKLTYQVAQFVPMSPEDADMVEAQFSHNVTAQLFQKLPGDMGAGVKVYLYDEGGELIRSTFTDSAGNFTFNKLDEEQNYVFKIATDVDNFTMVTYDEENKVIETKIRKEGNEFSYSPLGFIEHKVDESAAQDDDLISYDDGETSKELSEAVKSPSVAYRGTIDSDGKFVLFYDYDASNLGKEARERLNQFVLLFAEDEFLIEISSHTDQRGPAAYNMELSKRRTQSVTNYLKNKGIDASRLRGKWHGESQPLIDCDKKDCDHEDHHKNRRSEIEIK
jgi:outer membrane protein OmpA-like peptidoglycan-associated protein